MIAAHDTLHKVLPFSFRKVSLQGCFSRIYFTEISTINKDLTIFMGMRKDVKTYSSQKTNMRIYFVSVLDLRCLEILSLFRSIFIKGSKPCVSVLSKNHAAVLFFVVIASRKQEGVQNPNHNETETYRAG